MLIKWLIIFVLALIVLIKSSDFFTDSAEKIGLYFGLPAFIVGVTIVAIGTSLPELVSSIIAVIEHSSEIVVGDVVGSNITNIFLVLGVAAILGRRLKITYELIHVDLPLLVGSAFFLVFTLWDGKFNFFESLLALLGIVLYFLYTISSETKEKSDGSEKKKRKISLKDFLILIVSSVFIYLGAKYTVDSIVKISEILKIGKEIISASALALGTSLPELVVSATAAKKGNPEMAVGNVLGSNIFNSFAVMSISGLIGTLVIPKTIISFGLPVMVSATLLYFFITQDQEITKWEGYLLIIFYILFIGKLFHWF